MKPPRGSRRERVLVWLLGVLGAALVRALGATWRVEYEGPDPFTLDGPLVGVLWHRGLLMAAYAFRGRDMAVPVSRSRDGDRIDAVLRHLGFAESPRGSSSRGASALLRTLIREVRAGRIVAMLPDGPRGPARVAKPGMVALASTSGAKLVPVALSADRAWQFRSWDRLLLPRPFARVRCRYGEPLEIPLRTRNEALLEWTTRVGRTLDEMTDAVDREMGREPEPGGA